MPIATHWSSISNPEDWKDNPQADPLAEARRHMEENDDESWDDRDELNRQGSTVITLHGFRETAEPLDDDQAFDGYEPGQTYYVPTGETIKVRATVAYEVMP